MDTAGELAELLGRVQGSGYAGTFIIQDLIPGDDSGMRILTCYGDRDGQGRGSPRSGTCCSRSTRRARSGTRPGIITRHDETLADQATPAPRAPRLDRLRELRPEVRPARRQHRVLRAQPAPGPLELLHHRRRAQHRRAVRARVRAGPAPAARRRGHARSRSRTCTPCCRAGCCAGTWPTRRCARGCARSDATAGRRTRSGTAPRPTRGAGCTWRSPRPTRCASTARTTSARPRCTA